MDGYDRGRHVVDPSFPAGQQLPKKQDLYGGVFHIPGGQCRRITDPAGRPAAIFGIPARGVFFLDVQHHAPYAAGCHPAAGDLFYS